MITRSNKRSNLSLIIILLGIWLVLSVRAYIYHLPSMPGLTEQSMDLISLLKNPVIVVLLGLSLCISCLVIPRCFAFPSKVFYAAALCFFGFSCLGFFMHAQYILTTGPKLIMDLVQLSYSSVYVGPFGRFNQPIYPAQIVLMLMLVPPLLPIFIALMKQIYVLRKV